jgi:hypothetical protein
VPKSRYLVYGHGTGGGDRGSREISSWQKRERFHKFTSLAGSIYHIACLAFLSMALDFYHRADFIILRYCILIAGRYGWYCYEDGDRAYIWRALHAWRILANLALIQRRLGR